MSTLRQYCEKLSSEQLESAFQDNLEGVNPLSADVALLMGAILVERNRENLDVCEIFQRTLDHYLSCDIKNDL